MKILGFLGMGIVLVVGLGVIVENSLNNRQVEIATANAASAPLPKLTEPEKIAARKAYAKKLDSQLLDMKIESRTVTTGVKADTLVIEDALAGRVRAREIGQNAVLRAEMIALGFRELKYTNGDESWHWNLK
jgi:hypothetical protein